MAKSLINKVLDLITLLQEEEPTVIVFMKEDNSVREMKSTLNFKLIPPDKRPKKIDLKSILSNISKHKILHVFDIEKNGWRSIKLDKVKDIEHNKIKYMLKI